MEPHERLHIISALWGPRSAAKFPVTMHLRRNFIADRGCGAFLSLPTLHSKKELLGDLSGSKLDLIIKYRLDDGPEIEETFGEAREVLLGDTHLYYLSISRQHTGITADEADALLHMFRPTLFLHPDERSHPCRVEWYLPRTSLYLHCPDAPIKLLDRVTNPDTDLNSYYPYAGQRFHPRESRRFFLKQNADQPDTRFGEKENLDQVPYYGSCFRAPNGLICLTYFFFYAYNGPILQGSIVPNWIAQMAGVHEGDWEHVCILLSPRTKRIHGVFMSRHGKESRWYLRPSPASTADDGWHLDSKSGRVAIYCGKESHANYNTPGLQSRGYWGYIDDLCAKGSEWSPKAVVNLGTPANPRVPWLHYGGLWGKLKDAYVDHAGPTGPFMKPSYATVPGMHERNTTPPLGPWWNPQADD